MLSALLPSFFLPKVTKNRTIFLLKYCCTGARPQRALYTEWNKSHHAWRTPKIKILRFWHIIESSKVK